MTVYIIELEEPLGNPDNPHGQAKHYIGYCEEGRETQRLEEHRAGRGSRMLAAAAARGIKFDIIYSQPGTRELERKWKNYKNTRKLLKRLRKEGKL